MHGIHGIHGMWDLTIFGEMQKNASHDFGGIRPVASHSNPILWDAWDAFL